MRRSRLWLLCVGLVVWMPEDRGSRSERDAALWAASNDYGYGPDTPDPEPLPTAYDRALARCVRLHRLPSKAMPCAPCRQAAGLPPAEQVCGLCGRTFTHWCVHRG